MPNITSHARDKDLTGDDDDDNDNDYDEGGDQPLGGTPTTMAECPSTRDLRRRSGWGGVPSSDPPPTLLLLCALPPLLLLPARPRTGPESCGADRSSEISRADDDGSPDGAGLSVRIKDNSDSGTDTSSMG